MFELDHLGIAVESLEEAVPLFCQLLGLPPGDVEYHEVPTEKVKVAMLRGNVTIELLEPTDSASPIARYVAKRGPGFHHWCFKSPRPAAEHIAALAGRGFSLLDSEPRQGAEGQVFFVHPKSAGGMLTEFVEQG